MDGEEEKFDEDKNEEPKLGESELEDDEETGNILDQVDLGEPMDDRYSL